jgi:hypothetical protein
MRCAFIVAVSCQLSAISRRPQAMVFRRLSAPTKRSDEPSEHTFHVDNLCQETVDFTLLDVSEVAGKEQLTLNLTCRPKSHVKESSEISIRALDAAFCDIARN